MGKSTKFGCSTGFGVKYVDLTQPNQPATRRYLNALAKQLKRRGKTGTFTGHPSVKSGPR